MNGRTTRSWTCCARPGRAFVPKCPRKGDKVSNEGEVEEEAAVAALPHAQIRRAAVAEAHLQRVVAPACAPEFQVVGSSVIPSDQYAVLNLEAAIGNLPSVQVKRIEVVTKQHNAGPVLHHQRIDSLRVRQARDGWTKA